MCKFQRVRFMRPVKLIVSTSGVCALILGHENKKRLTKQKFIEMDK